MILFAALLSIAFNLGGRIGSKLYYSFMNCFKYYYNDLMLEIAERPIILDIETSYIDKNINITNDIDKKPIYLKLKRIIL